MGRIAIVMAILLVLAAAFAGWALFIYQPAPVGAATAAPTARVPANTPSAQAAATVVPATATLTTASTAAPTQNRPTASAPVVTLSAATRSPSPSPLPVLTGTLAPPTPVPPTPPPSSRVPSPDYGVHIFGWWRPEVSDRDMGLARDAGFTWIKQLFAWRDIEGAAKGHLDWSRSDRIVEQAGWYRLKLLVRVDVTPDWAAGGNGPMRDVNDFADFLAAMANRYRGRIAAYQVWNEPNLASEWGGHPPDPAAYASMLRAVYPRLKQADPAALVVSAGLAPTTASGDIAMPDIDFVRAMYAAGAAPYFDVLGVHGTGFKAPPEADPGDVAKDPVLGNGGDHSPVALKRVYCFRHVEDVRNVMVAAGDASKQVFILEFGWSSDTRPVSPYYWHSVTEEQKADYLVRAFKWAKEHWQPWIGVMSVIYISNPDWTEKDEQYWWGITYPGYPVARLRPAYTRLKEMPK